MKTIHQYLRREKGTSCRPGSFLSILVMGWLFVSTIAVRQQVLAQTPVVPFGSCETAGLFQLLGTGANQKVYQYNAELGVHTLFTEVTKDYQGLAYNGQNNLLYAIEKRGGSLMLLTIDQNKVKRDVGVLDLPNNINGMEFDGQGYLYAIVQNNSGSMFKIDVRTATPTLAVTTISYSSAVDVFDFGFDGTNNVFYSVDNNTGKNVLKIFPDGTVVNLGAVGLTGTFGSINLDVNGNLIIYENTGSLRAVRYVLDDSVVPGDVYTVHASQPTAGNNADFAGCGDLGDIPYSDLAIVKTVDQSSPFMGDTISFTLQVTNLTGPFFDYAPRRATGVVARDLLPSGYTWLSDNSSGKYNPGSGVWTLDSLNVGQTKSLTLTVLVNETGTYTNTTTVSSTIWDPHMSNNADTVATTPKRPAPNLYLLKSGFFVDADSNSVASVGDSIRYVFKLSNTGNVAFTSVILEDTLLTVLGGPLSNFDPAEKDSTTFAGSYLLTEDDIEAQFVKNRAKAIGYTAMGDTVMVESMAEFPLDPQDPFYDETCPECTIIPLPEHQANLSILKTVDVMNPFVEDTVLFRMIVRNNGPSKAKKVMVIDTLNTGFEYVSHSGPGTFVFPDWSLGIMAVDEVDTLYVTAIIKEEGLYTNTSVVTSVTADIDTTNNRSSVTLEPRQQGPALMLVKSGFFEDSNDNGAPNPGDSLRYVFRIENNGNVPFTFVDVLDSLITINGGPLTSLDLMEADSLTFTGWYVLDQGDINLGYVKNRAYAMGITTYQDTLMVPSMTGIPLNPEDPFYDEECPECTITVLPKVQADLSIVKSASTLTPVFGDTITFQIGVTNNGTSPATGVTVNEPIPSGFQFISASGAGSYTNPTWTIGNLSVGSTASLQVQVKVLNEGNYQNIVRVSGSLFDPDTTNNVASVTITPTPNAEILVIKTADKDTLISGDPISFSFMITNNGPNSASAVTLTDNLPAGYGSITNISNGGTLTGNTVSWPAFNLAVGDTIYRTFDAIVQPTGPYENTAIVVATEFDPILPNNTSTTKPLVNPKKKILALDDEYVLPVEEQGTGNPSVGNVLINDTLNGSPATLSNVVISVIEPSTEPGVQLNPLTGVVSVAGNLGAGPFTLTYRICEIEMPSNCDLGVVTVRVTQRRVLRLTSIEGNIWYEYVEDDVWDDKLAAGLPATMINETPMQGWKVNLYGSDLYGNSISQSTLTRQDGTYSFENIPEGRYRIDREYREEWVPAFPLVIRDDPKGKFHIINVDYGYGGIAGKDRRVVAGNEKGWLLDVEAGKDSLYAGAYLYLDTNMDNVVDQTLFVSGSMFMSWKDVSNNRVDYNIDGLYMQGWSKDLTDIDLRLLPQRSQPGTLLGGVQDSLVNSSLDLRFELRVSGERWTTQFEAPVRLQGQVAQMLPYQQRHTLEAQAGYDFYNGYGRKVARLLGMEFMPLYGADFGVNQSIFGTAPDDKYPVRMETDGARHVQPVLLTERKLLLGTGLDQSLLTVRNNLRHGVITQKTAVTGYGVEFLNDIRAEQEGRIKVTTTDQGYLHAWIDFNKDGIWSTTEKVVNGQRLNQGETTLSFMVPNTVRSGVTYARFRYCDCPSGLTAQGVFTGGEVEDYRLNLSAAYGSITGEVWQDHNTNGIRDPQDQGLSNMRVFVDYNQNRIYETGEPLALTNETGAFTIQNVPVGTWNVQPDYEGKWLLTNIPGPPFATVAMQEAAVKSSVDFGLMRLKLTSTDDDSALPLTFDLEQNYPNPFNPITTINYQLAEKSYVKLTVLDLNGRVVATLVDREIAAGRYTVKFDGSHLSSGVYVYQLVAGDVTMTRKMTLLK